LNHVSDLMKNRFISQPKRHKIGIGCLSGPADRGLQPLAEPQQVPLERILYIKQAVAVF
jgi:hypothetical protein